MRSVPVDPRPLSEAERGVMAPLGSPMVGVTRLLGDGALERSSVVANCAMNRERSLSGSNGYGRELGIDIVAELTARASGPVPVRWLDLCCGSGRALAEATWLLGGRHPAVEVEILGLDLVDHFTVDPCPPVLRLVTGSVTEWLPDVRFDLITCVHGLHYVGDKLGALARISSWLTGGGLFAANFDARSIRHADGTAIGRRLTSELRGQGFTYDSARRRIARRGGGEAGFPYRYLGADDRAGPNYTGQPAVDSCYEPLPGHPGSATTRRRRSAARLPQ